MTLNSLQVYDIVCTHNLLNVAPFVPIIISFLFPLFSIYFTVFHPPRQHTRTNQCLIRAQSIFNQFVEVEIKKQFIQSNRYFPCLNSHMDLYPDYEIPLYIYILHPI
jgi:poly-D-alanine transfer protein DltD